MFGKINLFFKKKLVWNQKFGIFSGEVGLEDKSDWERLVKFILRRNGGFFDVVRSYCGGLY